MDLKILKLRANINLIKFINNKREIKNFHQLLTIFDFMNIDSTSQLTKTYQIINDDLKDRFPNTFDFIIVDYSVYDNYPNYLDYFSTLNDFIELLIKPNYVFMPEILGNIYINKNINNLHYVLGGPNEWRIKNNGVWYKVNTSEICDYFSLKLPCIILTLKNNFLILLQNNFDLVSNVLLTNLYCIEEKKGWYIKAAIK